MDETLDGFLDNIDAIDEEDLLRMDESEQELNVDEVVPTEATSESVGQQPQQTATTAEVAQPEKEEKGNALKTTAEALLAIPTGPLDWGISLYNKTMPGEVIDIPNIPEFQNDVTQSLREI